MKDPTSTKTVHVKTITIPVNITVKVNDDVNPNDITFDLDLSRTIPVINGEPVGKAIEYTTGEPVEE